MQSQHAVDHPTFPVNQRYFHFVVIQDDCEAAFNQPPDIRNWQGVLGNVLANPRASSSSLHPGELNPCIASVTEDTSHATSERQNSDTVLDPRCQSGPSARNKGPVQKTYW